ncbi:MAG: hypothetical protein IJ997_02890, partial [Mycoplasmataceae bacterium]|nr:hypothetical protein [Mycoplasmataceae bacterium]
SLNLFKRSKSNTDEKELREEEEEEEPIEEVEEEPKQEEEPMEKVKEEPMEKVKEEPKSIEGGKCKNNFECFQNSLKDYIRNFIDSNSKDDQLENKIESYFKEIPKKTGFFSSNKEYIEAKKINKWFNDWKKNTCNIIYLRKLVELLNDKELENNVNDNEEKIFNNNNCESVFIKLYATKDDITNLNNCNVNSNCHEIISELKNLTIKLYNENDIKKDCECNEKCAEKYFKTNDMEYKIKEYREKLTEMEDLEKQHEEEEARMKKSSENLNKIINELENLEKTYVTYIGNIVELNESNKYEDDKSKDFYNDTKTIISKLEDKQTLNDPNNIISDLKNLNNKINEINKENDKENTESNEPSN